MATILIHGLYTTDGGKSTIDRLKPYLTEPVKEMDYGFIGVLTARFYNRHLAKKLLKLARKNDRIIAHSNGCTIVAKALQMGLEVKHITFIHPALEASWQPPAGKPATITVFYSHKDKVGYLALLQKLLSPLNALFGKTGYGAMMTYGSTSGDRRIRSINDHSSHSGGFYNTTTLRMYIQQR